MTSPKLTPEEKPQTLEFISDDDNQQGSDFLPEAVQYTMNPSTARGSSLAVNDHTLGVQVTPDRPSTP